MWSGYKDGVNMNNEIPCTKKHKTISRKDLPLCCPTSDERLWDGHPRVYLEIEERGHVTCPYCGTEYHLSHEK